MELKKVAEALRHKHYEVHIAEDSEGDMGWVADEPECGTDKSVLDKAIGIAVDLVGSGVELATDPAREVLDVATSATKSLVGAAGSLVNSAMNAFTPSSPEAQAQQSAQTPSNDGGNQEDGGLLSTIGDAIGNALGKT